MLLSYGANAELVDDGQASPLHYASRSGHLDAINMILESNSNLSVLVKKDSQGLTPAAYPCDDSVQYSFI